MKKLLIIFIFSASALFANDVIHQRQGSMQDFNKLMRSATQILNDGETQGLEDIYTKIESIMIEYPNLFPNDSFEGKTKASQNIIEDRDAFNIIAQDTIDLAALAKIAASNNDLEATQQHHQNLFGSCKSCHSRFKN
jgi:cytochrome c556